MGKLSYGVFPIGIDKKSIISYTGIIQKGNKPFYMAKEDFVMYQQGNADLSALEQERRRNPLYKHVAKTYLWMCIGLAITFLIGFGLTESKMIFLIYAMPLAPIILLVLQIILVVALSSRITKLSVGACRGIFLGYSALTGVTMGAVLTIYDAGSALLAFGVSAFFFGSMAVAGLVTKRDLSKFGPVVVFGLVALLVMQVLNMFLRLETLDVMLCFIGIALFLGITTYDAKKTKDFYYAFENSPEMLEKVSIFSALNLYLDFINLFLYLIRLLGKRR